jgi:hypothetical protein
LRENAGINSVETRIAKPDQIAYTHYLRAPEPITVACIGENGGASQYYSLVTIIVFRIQTAASASPIANPLLDPVPRRSDWEERSMTKGDDAVFDGVAHQVQMAYAIY